MSNHRYGIWKRCLGCGELVAFFPDGQPEHDLPPGTVAHTKPKHLAGVPNSAPCELYQRTSAENFTLFHAAEPEVDVEPTSMKPFEQ